MRYFLVTAAMQLSCAASPFLKANALRIRPVDLAIRRGDRHVSFAITQKLKRLVEVRLAVSRAKPATPREVLEWTVKIMACVLWHVGCELRC